MSLSNFEGRCHLCGSMDAERTIPDASSEMSRLFDRVTELTAELQSSREDAERLAVSLSHMRVCSTCAEGSWESCEGGREALEALAAHDKANS